MSHAPCWGSFRVLPLLVLAAALGCNGTATAPNPTVDAGTDCEPCPTGQGCDTTTRTCVPAAPLGSSCGSSADGGPSVCVDGELCGPVTASTFVCTKPCNAPTDCGTGQSCYGYATTQTSAGYCGTEVALGGACSIAHLEECAGGSNGEVVECLGTEEAGTCVARCATSTDCGSGQGCSAPFADGYGVCIPPTMGGSACYGGMAGTFALCSAGQTCVLQASGSGICHSNCGADAGTCSSPEVCTLVDPCHDTEGFCVTPAAEGGSCNGAQGQFCAPADDCVNVGSGLLCELDCTSGATCATGTSCHALPATDGGFTCRKACF